MALAQAGSNLRGEHVPVARVATKCAAQLCAAPDAQATCRSAGVPSLATRARRR